MFLPLEFQSVNTPDQLKAGEYRAIRRGYVLPHTAKRMLEFTYTATGDSQACACEFIFVDEHGAVRCCDFLRLPDRAWRDSFGAKADYLTALLPGEVAAYELVDEEDLGSLILEERQ